MPDGAHGAARSNIERACVVVLPAVLLLKHCSSAPCSRSMFNVQKAMCRASDALTNTTTGCLQVILALWVLAWLGAHLR